MAEHTLHIPMATHCGIQFINKIVFSEDLSPCVIYLHWPASFRL